MGKAIQNYIVSIFFGYFTFLSALVAYNNITNGKGDLLILMLLLTMIFGTFSIFTFVNGILEQVKYFNSELKKSNEKTN